MILSCAAALLTAACSEPPQAEIDYGAGVEFVPFVVDNLDDAGLGNAITLDKDGIPYVSYLIFPGELAADAIPLPRPIGAPFISTTATPSEPSQEGAAVGVASVSANGTWTRGAAAQVQESPLGITIPYGPATVDSLIGSTADNTNGTDIAIDANGGKHVVWAGRDGIWYAGAGATGAFKESQVDEWTPSLAHAGPLGRPSVAVDRSGTPWVAYTVDTAAGQAVQVASLAGNKWIDETAATIGSCSGSGCSQPGPTEIGMTADGPVVVYGDAVTGDLMAATKAGDSWTTSAVQAGIFPSGLSMTVGAGGAPYVAYYGDGAVYLAEASGTGWTTAKVADADAGSGTDNAAQTTGVAVDDAGTIYVAWYDEGMGVLLSSGDGSSFTPVETPDTSGGGYPSLAVTAEGSRIYLAWYDLASQDLLLGIQGEVGDLLVAQPSPTPEAVPTQAPPTDCAPDGADLQIVALGSTFDLDCLAVQAGTDFNVTLDNQDPLPHDFSIYPSAADLTNALFSSIQDPNNGSTTNTYPIPALDAGTYYFQCDFHPTTMFGNFIVT